MDEKELQAELLEEFQSYDIENSGKKVGNGEDNEKNESESDESNHLTAFIIITVLWIQGMRANSNLIYVPDEQQIYCGNGENKAQDAIRFRCYSNNCTAKVYLKKDGTVVREQSSGRRHDHGSMYTKYKEMECINSMKKLCLSAPASTLPREIYDQAVLE